MSGINDKPKYMVRARHRNGYESNVGLAYQQSNRRVKVVVDYLPTNWSGELILVRLSKEESEIL